MTGTQQLPSRPHDHALVQDAWNRFVEGNNDLDGVRPEVAMSWHRCRDQFRVDPYLAAPPAAIAEATHPLQHDVVFAELGFSAAAIAREVANVSGIVVVADSTGRILTEWGDKTTSALAAEAGLAPWYCWLEDTVGTNGVGTALGTQGPVLVRREEHWCRAFHNWTCAGIAVRDVVTKAPIAAVNVSSWRRDLSATCLKWLSNTALHIENKLRKRAHSDGAELLAAFDQARARSTAPLAAIDTVGKVVIADDTASVLLGVPGSTPAADPGMRWLSRLPAIGNAARFATGQAESNPQWTGSTWVATYLSDQASKIHLQPKFLNGSVIGHLMFFSDSEGEGFPLTESTPPVPGRIAGVRDNRTVLLQLCEVAVAESDGNEVWLSTDLGKLRGASHGLDKLDHELGSAGFMRVHRQYIVNLNRIREVERGDKGELTLIMDDPAKSIVPVSRRNMRSVRGALGI